MSLPVPKGWTFSENSLNEWQWRPPDQPDFGYVLRVEQVLSNRRSIEWTLDRRIDELREDESNVEVLEPDAATACTSPSSRPTTCATATCGGST